MHVLLKKCVNVIPCASKMLLKFPKAQKYTDIVDNINKKVPIFSGFATYHIPP